MLFRFSFLLLAALSAGCGLVDSDVTQFDISLPQKTLSVDTAQWELTSMSSLPAVDCSSDATICSQSLSSLCTSDDCSGACDGTSCQVVIAVHLFKDFNLKSENPALQDLDDTALISVKVSKIFYEVTANTMNVDSPPLEVYIAPATVMTPTDAAAEHIGTIPAVPAGMLVSEGELVLDAGGEAIIAGFLEDWTTPFNFIVAAEVVVSAGDPVPTGKIDAAVRVNASAGLN